VWRLISDKRMSVTLDEIECIWTYADIMDANAVLDMMNDYGAGWRLSDG
jgi:hypothetical protein